jgi:nitrous oxidase accessory protein NosD
VRAPAPDQAADPDADGSAARPYLSIGRALREAPAGTIVRIAEGAYAEQLVLDKAAVLLGDGPARTRLTAPAGSHGPVVAAQDGARVELRDLAIERAALALTVAGGGARLQNVALRHLGEAALLARDAEIVFLDGEVLLVGGGTEGVALRIDGGSLEMRRSVLRAAGRRAIEVRHGRALLQDLAVSGSGLAAVQALDGAEVTVEGGRFERLGGSALYAGGARLIVRRASVLHAEYAVVGFRDAEVDVRDSQFSDTRVANVGLVRSQGVLERCLLARGGTDGAVAITASSGTVRLIGNRISQPGPIGVHITSSTVVVTDNTIVGARLDLQKDLGDGVYAIDADLSLERNQVRGNAGAGVVLTRSRVRLLRNRLSGNGRAGLVLLDRSSANADSNVFENNRGPGVEIAERSVATFLGNRFGGNAAYHIDAACVGGSVELGNGNAFLGRAAPRRSCP